MDVRFQAEGIKFNFRAAGILIERDHVLLHKQREDHHWALPGGGIELGERSKDAVVREFEEELGCKCNGALSYGGKRITLYLHRKNA